MDICDSILCGLVVFLPGKSENVFAPACACTGLHKQVWDKMKENEKISCKIQRSQAHTDGNIAG